MKVFRSECREFFGSDFFRRLRRYEKGDGSCFTGAWENGFKKGLKNSVTVRFGTVRHDDF